MNSLEQSYNKEMLVCAPRLMKAVGSRKVLEHLYVEFSLTIHSAVSGQPSLQNHKG